MMLSARQLASHLEKGLAPVYLLSGDEPLQLMEAADAIRARARAEGYTEREVLTVDRDFQWSSLQEAAGTMSLFAERRLIDLRMPTPKPGREGSAAIAAFAEAPPPDVLLLIQTGRIDADGMKARWVKAIDKAGVVLRVWPLKLDETRQWVAERMRARGLAPEPEAVEFLAERTEGNLLAAAQEIEKLLLLRGEGPVSLDDMVQAVADQARHDLFDLVDAVLAGDARRSVRLVGGLLAEGSEPILLLWALAREFRTLEGLAQETARGHDLEQAMNSRRVFRQRRPLVRRALGRFGVAHWQALLEDCARLDRITKGAAAGEPRDELLQLVLRACGRPLLQRPDSASMP